MLTLPIKKKWFDMILSGEKKEEYRESKPYYTTRFRHLWQGSLIGYGAERRIRFRNGYAKDSPTFIARVTLDFGEGKPEWGAEKGKLYYIIRIKSIERGGAENDKEADDKHIKRVYIRNISRE